MARKAASENTHPQCRRAMKGTVPDISRRDSGQTNGAREGMLEVVDEEGAE